MALHTTIRISIGETTLSVIDNFMLTENVGNHATFKIAIEGKHFVNGGDTSTALLENSQSYLGETCIVRVEDLSNNSENEPFAFKGIVTHLEGHRDNNDGQIREMVIISGMSSSILLDSGSDMQSHLEQPLSSIVSSTIEGYDQSLLNVVVAPEVDDTLGYTVQQQQSKFAYLQHLAAKQGEYLLYSKDTLYFGKPNLGGTIPLTLGSSLENISLGLDTAPSKFSYFTNDYLNQAQVVSATEDAADASTAGFTSLATTVSNSLYPKTTQIAFSTYEDPQLQQRLDAALAKQKKANTQAQVTLHGTSYKTAVSLGMVISIRNGENTYGEYRVTSVTHTCGDSGNYKNTFSAIPMEVDVYPNTNINASVKSGTQVAKVIDNVDPEGMSRIKVQFPWQAALNLTTPWLRVLTPSSGADKGFHLIPEIDDEVLVGFEGGDTERPYVMGSLYTGVNKPESWQSDANNIKAIRTRSGHTIELNDTKGEEMIRIYDNDASIIEFNTQEKSLTINATEDLNLTAKNINIEAQENIVIGAQQNVDIAAEGDLSNLAQGNLALQSSGDTSIKSNGAVAVEATSDATVKGVNAIIEGTASAEVNAVQAKINGSAMTEVAGTIIKLN